VSKQSLEIKIVGHVQVASGYIEVGDLSEVQLELPAPGLDGTYQVHAIKAGGEVRGYFIQLGEWVVTEINGGDQ
jgi:hypothetical protein